MTGISPAAAHPLGAEGGGGVMLMSAAIDTEDEFRISLRVRNNRLLSAIEASGLSVPKFCELNDISYAEAIAYVSLKRSPLTKYGGWRESALKLADAFGCLPDELFPPDTLVAIRKAEASFTVAAQNVAALFEENNRPELLAEQGQTRERIHEALATLPERVARVIRMRFGIGEPEQSLEEVAQAFDVTRGRIRQIEAKGLRMLRGRERIEPLRWLLDSDFIDLENKAVPDETEHDANSDEDPPISAERREALVACREARKELKDKIETHNPQRHFTNQQIDVVPRTGRHICLVGGPMDGRELWAPPGAKAFVVSQALYYAPTFENGEIWGVVEGEPPAGTILETR